MTNTARSGASSSNVRIREPVKEIPARDSGKCEHNDELKEQSEDTGVEIDVSEQELNVRVGEEIFMETKAVPGAARGAKRHLGGIGLERTENWHLLDVDGRSEAASSTSSSSNEQEGTNELSSFERRQRRRLNRRLLNIEKMTTIQGYRPVERQKSMSPSLVYVCALTYALMPLASFVAFLILLWLLLTPYWPLTVIYYSYLIWDSKTCNRGGRRIDAVYRSRFWTYLAAHFPIKLSYSKHFRLDPNENYILNYHPHGIAAFGCVTAFATNGLNFSKLFPGIKSRFMVHETSFLVPIMREAFSFRGDCSVNSKSFDYILSKKWQPAEPNKREAGNLLALCGGGLAEADLSDAECLKIVVASRKGFVKKALIHGAHLIPCIAFGENSIFTKINFKPNSILYRLEQSFYNIFKFKHPLYYGTSAFGFKQLRGAMPYKRPITVVMGDPIRVERIEQPSQKEIDEYHSKYMESLRSIYAKNKQLCSKYDVRLELV